MPAGTWAPNISTPAEVTSNLRVLLKKDVAWNWSHEHDRSLKNLKQLLTSAPVLKYFDVNKPVEIQTDASRNGLGSCLLQEGHPIAYTSRTLTSAEQNYAQIEKELSAIVFACNKFFQYVYFRKTRVQTDHKPLEAIVNKPLWKASPRLQRMLLKLQKYTLDVTYVPEKEMFVADMLSRAFLSDYLEDFDPEMDLVVHSLIRNLLMTAEKLLSCYKRR